MCGLMSFFLPNVSIIKIESKIGDNSCESVGKRTCGRKFSNKPRLLNSLISNTSLFLFKRCISHQPSRGPAMDKPNQKNKIFIF